MTSQRGFPVGTRARVAWSRWKGNQAQNQELILTLSFLVTRKIQFLTFKPRCLKKEALKWLNWFSNLWLCGRWHGRNIYFGGKAVIKQPRFLSMKIEEDTFRFGLDGFILWRRLSFKDFLYGLGCHAFWHFKSFVIFNTQVGCHRIQFKIFLYFFRQILLIFLMKLFVWTKCLLIQM